MIPHFKALHFLTVCALFLLATACSDGGNTGLPTDGDSDSQGTDSEKWEDDSPLPGDPDEERGCACGPVATACCDGCFFISGSCLPDVPNSSNGACEQGECWVESCQNGWHPSSDRRTCQQDTVDGDTDDIIPDGDFSETTEIETGELDLGESEQDIPLDGDDEIDEDSMETPADGDEEEEVIYGPAGTLFTIVGFGADTLGGWQDGGDEYIVTSLEDSGPGTLREGLNSGGVPRVILFNVNGRITLSSPLIVPSNISIDGRGHHIVVAGKGFVIPGSDQVILINLALEDIGPETEDGIQIGSALPDPSEFIVLDHIRLTQHGDGGNCENVDEAISIVFGSRNITIAWCRFDLWEKVLLAGNGDAEASLDSQISLTWHHSYAFETGRRHPQARYGRYHLFNNFWDDWRMYGWEYLPPYHESFGSQIQDNGRMLLEGQMVRRHPHPPYEVLSTANDASRCESGGDLLEYGTWMDPASTAPLVFGTGCAQRQAFEVPYTYSVETAGSALRDKVVAGSGNTL